MIIHIDKILKNTHRKQLKYKNKVIVTLKLTFLENTFDNNYTNNLIIKLNEIERTNNIIFFTDCNNSFLLL